MKTAFVSLLAAAALAAPLIAHADDPKPPFQDALSWATQANWLNCVDWVDVALHDRDAPLDPSTKVHPLAKAIGSLAAGATPTGAELRAECIAQAKVDPNKTRVWHDELGYVGNILREAEDMKEHPYDKSYQTVAQEVRGCDSTIALATEVLGADAQVTFDVYQKPAWTGTLPEAKTQFCDVGHQAVDAEKAKIVGPFTKAGIKNDKLKILDEYNYSVEIGVPGGDFTLEPKKLAKANPWFSSANGDDCAGGHVITHLHRYQFDNDQKLVKESTKDYCGAVPKSAYR